LGNLDLQIGPCWKQYLVSNAQNKIFNQNKKIIKKSSKDNASNVKSVKVANRELETLELHQMSKIVGKEWMQITTKNKGHEINKSQMKVDESPSHLHNF